LDLKDKIYWHDAHYEALQLELYKYEDALEFRKEYELSKEALRMDTLVIKKTKDIQIDKNIGRIFRNHNIVEYKSELDNFDFWDFQKVLAYAHLYSSFEKVHMSDITISISLTIYPRELVKHFENVRGCRVEDTESGIRYVHGDIVPIQILESKKLSENENLFLRNLRSNLNKNDMYKTMKTYKERKPINNKNVFLDRVVKANPNAFKEALTMFTENTREIIMEAIEESGWLNNRDSMMEIEKAKKIARKMLTRGDSPSEVAEVTDLQMDTVIEIANQMQKLPVGV